MNKSERDKLRWQTTKSLDSILTSKELLSLLDALEKAEAETATQYTCANEFLARAEKAEARAEALERAIKEMGLTNAGVCCNTCLGKNCHQCFYNRNGWQFDQARFEKEQS